MPVLTPGPITSSGTFAQRSARCSYSRISRGTVDESADAVERVEVEEVAEQRAELVAGALRLGGDAPALAELGAVVEPEHRLRVADVDREQHRGESKRVY